MSDQTVLTDDLLTSFDQSILDVDEACTLPPACYTTDEFLEFERRSLFDHEWLCVGRVDQIRNPGDYFTTTVNDERLIIARAKNGEIIEDHGNIRVHFSES